MKNVEQLPNGDVKILGVFQTETTDAVCFKTNVVHKELWFPCSHVKQVNKTSALKGGGFIVVSEWIAKKKGLL